MRSGRIDFSRAFLLDLHISFWNILELNKDNGYILTMNLKRKPNRKQYISILKSMTPEMRLKKALKLSKMTRELFEQGLRKRHPDLPPDKFKDLLFSRLEKCHNKNY